jgi:hypothetical protein
MRCPDGCGELLTINLDPRACAHFIIWRDRLIWCDGDDLLWRDEPLSVRVHRALLARPLEFQHFETLAAELDEIPWEVIWADQGLERRGLAEVHEDAYFRPASSTSPFNHGDSE